MKKIGKYALLSILAVTMSGCNIWQDEWAECIPIPEVETPVEQQPWEPDSSKTEVGE
jgi:hypothetical protein